jgi:hypothetical protein
MAARHVFLETNWVVACFAPAHFQMSDASNLLHETKQGRILLHVPSVCLSEARSVIRRKFQPRTQADNLRNYLRWAKQETIVSEEKRRIVREVLDTYENVLQRELDRLEERLATLGKELGVEVFPLTDRMLERSVQLGTERLELDPVGRTREPGEPGGNQGTDGTFSDNYLTWFAWLVMIQSLKEWGTSRLSPSPRNDWRSIE